MMKKIFSVLLGVAAISCVEGADLLTELTAKAPNAYRDCRLTKKNNVTVEKDGLVFNGTDSYLHLGTPKLSGSFIVAFQVKLDKLPENMATFYARRGFHNVLACNKDGQVIFEIWGNDKRARLIVRSKQKLEPGKFYTIAGVVNRETPQLKLQLYINGALEGEGSLACPPFEYGNELIFGSANPYGKGSNTLAGTLNNIQVYNGILPEAKLQKLIP